MTASELIHKYLRKGDFDLSLLITSNDWVKTSVSLGQLELIRIFFDHIIMDRVRCHKQS